MPTVPYTRQVSASQGERVVSSPRPGADVFAGSAQGAGQIGQALQGIGNALLNEEIKTESQKLIADLDADIQSVRVQYNEFQNDLRLNTTDQDAKAVIPTATDQWLTQKAGELGEKWKGNAFAEQYIARQYGSFEADSAMNAYSYATTKERDFITRTQESKELIAVQDVANLMMPTEEWQARLSDAAASRQALMGPDAIAENKILVAGMAKRRDSYYNDAVNLAFSDANAFLDMYPKPDKGKWGEHKNIPLDVQKTMTASEYQTLLSRGWQVINTKNGAVSVGLDNISSLEQWAMERGDVQPLVDLYEKAASIPGVDSKKVEGIARSIDTLNGILPNLNLQPGTPIITQLASSTNYLEDRKTPETTSYYNNWQNKVDSFTGEKLKQIKSDPAQYVMPVVESEYADLSPAEMAMARYTQQQKDFIGLPIEPKVMTKQEMSVVTSEWNSGDYQRRADLILEMNQSYGTLSQAAMLEAKIPNSVVSVAPVFSDLDPAVQTRLIAAASNKAEQIEPDATVRKNARDSAANSNLVRTLDSIATNMYRSEAQQNLANSMRSTITSYILMGGEVADIENAFYIQNDNGSAIIAPSQFGSDTISSGLEFVRNDAYANVPNEEWILNLPESERNQAISLRRSQISNGLWSFDGENNGYVMIDSTGGGIVFGINDVRPNDAEILGSANSLDDLNDIVLPSNYNEFRRVLAETPDAPYRNNSLAWSARPVVAGNIDLNNRQVVTNSDGRISTVRSIGISEDGYEVLIPTVSEDGRLLDENEARELYRETGKHLGKFTSIAAASLYARRLHDAQDALYGGR